MRYLPLLLLALLSGPLGAQSGIDEISQQASQLESELGKVRDTSPEAAELLLKLVDLYHQHGRAFGLISAGQKFTVNHGAHPRHAEVMLRLIDGLQITSRNKELTAACRQFLGRYTEHKECARIEILLADTL